ncbi:GNAT family N-acetyltransferase [Agrococcus sediminis]|uniref:GNAT family N-acetyltransferase n=1 Tax=Agrococcus sediminis TaxID=2599924 RepID=UPI00343BA41E
MSGAAITVERGDMLGETFRRRITEVYVRAFADDFRGFSRDASKLADAFEHMLLLERFHLALVDGEPAGLASLTEGDEQLFAPDRREILRHLGPVRGRIADRVIRSWFMGAHAGSRPGVAEIGFVATEPAHQGKGVATALLTHLLALPQYREYVLEDIKDTNGAALHLYAKLGFEVYRRRSVRFSRRAGFNELVSMRLAQDTPPRAT